MRRDAFWIIARIAACDIKLTCKERSMILWTFVMPLVFIIFFGYSSRGSSGSAPRARLTVENHDEGFLSSKLVEVLRGENVDVIDTLLAGEDPIRTLVIPSDFTRKVLGRERVTLVLKREGGSNIQAAEAASVAIMRGLIRIVSGLIEMEGAELERRADGFVIRGDSISGSLWELARSSPGKIESLNVDLDSLLSRESLVTVNAALAGKGREIPTGFQASVPGTLVMFVLMSMVFSGTGITAERAIGVLRRLGATPAGKGEIVLGKLFGRMGIAGMQIIFLLLVGRFAFRISLGNDPLALIVLMGIFAFCTGSFSILFGSLFKNPDQVAGFAIITTLVMAALGGCWWPIEVVSRPFRIVAFCLPTGWAINGLHKVISFGFGVTRIGPHIAVLGAFGALFILLASRNLKWTLDSG